MLDREKVTAVMNLRYKAYFKILAQISKVESIYSMGMFQHYSEILHKQVI